jgi:hypothetical protein
MVWHILSGQIDLDRMCGEIFRGNASCLQGLAYFYLVGSYPHKRQHPTVYYGQFRLLQPMAAESVEFPLQEFNMRDM